MGKVILIGGSPMTGKSTLAMELAAEFKYQCISTDDIGETLQTITSINPMQGIDFRTYYATSSIDKLIKDIQQYHKAMEPAISRLLDIHSSWGNSLIMEGWALYPSHIQQYASNNISAIWLIASHELLETRLLNSPAFLDGIAAQNYLYRSMWHNALILKQCKDCNTPFITLHGNESLDSLAKEVLSSF